MCTRYSAPQRHRQLGPMVNGPHVSATQCRGGGLTSEILLTARSLAVASPALDSTRYLESTSALGWLRGSPELARWWPWRTAVLRGGGLTVSSDDKPR